jgi:hypothetical protein
VRHQCPACCVSDVYFPSIPCFLIYLATGVYSFFHFPNCICLLHLCLGFLKVFFCSAGLVFINAFRFSLFWKVFISPAIMKFNFAGQTGIDL